MLLSLCVCVIAVAGDAGLRDVQQALSRPGHLLRAPREPPQPGHVAARLAEDRGRRVPVGDGPGMDRPQLLHAQGVAGRPEGSQDKRVAPLLPGGLFCLSGLPHSPSWGRQHRQQQQTAGGSRRQLEAAGGSIIRKQQAASVSRQVAGSRRGGGGGVTGRGGTGHMQAPHHPIHPTPLYPHPPHSGVAVATSQLR